MSRIHEALKKAEQERALTSPVLETAVPAAPAFPEEPNADPIVSGGIPSVGSFGSSYSPDALLARCPLLEWKPDLSTMLFMNGNDARKGTEEYRTLRSRLYDLRERTNLKTLLVTSALPREGKSFTASNLAQVLARQHGRRVLLIDADLRGPRLHLMLGTTSGPGLSDYLQGQSDEYSIIQRGPFENLFFIPSGAEIQDPAELVGNGKLKLLVQRVEALFDWIVVDSPPAIPVSDASVLAKACDGVILVVRSNSTPTDVARKARQEFPEQSLIGVVLNGTNIDEDSYSRYYYETYDKKTSAAKS